VQRLVKDGTPVEVAVLALLTLVGAASSALAVVAPVSDNAPVTLQASFSVLGIVMAGTILAFGPRVTRPVVHALLVVDVLLISLLVATSVTERGMMVSALVYVWVAVSVALFFTPHVVRRYATLITVSCGVALLFARSEADVTIWVLVSATVWVPAIVISRLSQRLLAQAHHDTLTGLLNRNGFLEAAERERAIATRRGAPVMVAVIDLDGFKVVNDRGGHAAGDRLLVELSSLWRFALRPSDLLARYGGDEFVLLLPDTTPEAAELVHRRLVAAHPSPWTWGQATWDLGEDLSACIARADAQLYAAKAAVEVVPPLPPVVLEHPLEGLGRDEDVVVRPGSA